MLHSWISFLNLLIGALAALGLHGPDADPWDEPPFLDKVPPLNARRLASVRDDKPFAHDERKLPEELPPDVRDEDAVYWQAVCYAAKVPADVFARAAEANRHVTFGHLYTEPAKYRGKVVHFEGRLVRLKRLDPPSQAQRQGIAALYEAWVYLDQAGTHPLCVIVPHKPTGVDVGDGLNVRVTLDGYFFKRYRYWSGRLDEDKNNIALSTVLVIAPTLTTKSPARAAGWSLSGGSLFPLLIAFGTGVVVFMVVMTWWFRRNDRLVQARLQAVRANRFAEQAAELEQTLAAAEKPSTNGPSTTGPMQPPPANR